MWIFDDNGIYVVCRLCVGRSFPLQLNWSRLKLNLIWSSAKMCKQGGVVKKASCSYLDCRKKHRWCINSLCDLPRFSTLGDCLLDSTVMSSGDRDARFLTCSFGLCSLTGFEFVQQLPTPSLQFGGRTGNVVTALIFKRVHWCTWPWGSCVLRYGLLILYFFFI